MRKSFIGFLVVSLSLIVFSGLLVQRGKANQPLTRDSSTGFQDTSGTPRCTRLDWKGLAKSKKLGHTRCTRSRPRLGKILVNTPPKLELKASTQNIILACKAGETPTTCTADPCRIVTLLAISSDADGDQVLYTYTTTGGRVTDGGSAAIWNLSGEEPGTYTATVEVDDGCGCTASNSVKVTVAACGDCK